MEVAPVLVPILPTKVGTTGQTVGTFDPEKIAETAKLKWEYLLHPDSVFDDLGLVGKRTTRAYTTKSQNIETSPGYCAKGWNGETSQSG